MNRHFRFIRKTASTTLISLPKSSSVHKATITFLTTFIVMMPAVSADLNWVAGTGDWENASNWSSGFGSMVPDDDSFVFIDNGGTAQVLVPGATAFEINLSNGSLDILGGGQLESSAGNVIGGGAGSSGAVTVDGIGSSWQLSGPIARLKRWLFRRKVLFTITNGGEVLNADSSLGVTIGENVGSNGTVTVDGAGSNFTNIQSSVIVGNSGSGTLNILNGGYGQQRLRFYRRVCRR